MALRDMFNRVKVIIGGMRSDAAPVIADGDPAPLRLNADSELMVSVSSTVGEQDVNIDEVGGTATENGGAAGLLGVGVNRWGGTAVANGGVAGLPGAGINKWGGTDVVTGGVAGLPGVGLNKIGSTDVVDGGPSGTLGIGGPVAHDVASTQNPVLAGAIATANPQAAVTEGRLSQLSTNLTGWLRTLGDITHIGSTAVVSSGLAGVLPVGGTGADEAAPSAAYSVRVAGIVRKILTSLTDTYKQSLLVDGYGRLWSRSAAYDDVAAADRVSCNTIADDRDESAQVWAADTNVAATTTYYPSSSGYEIGNRDQLVIQLTMTDNTTTIEASNNGTTWIDVTPTVLDMETGTYLNASFACGAGASDNWMLDLDGFGPRYVRCAVLTPDAGNAAGIIAFTRKR
jgi:hypothetical protein